MTRQPVGRARPGAIATLFGRAKPIIGVVHLPALPGSPRYEGQGTDALTRAALADAECYRAGGADGLIVENHGDIPFAKPDHLGPETSACMAVIADTVRRVVGLPLGVNVLANGALHALAVAKAAGAQFVRVNQWANAYVANEGLIEGPAAVATRYRAWLHAQSVRIFADVHVKHGAHAITADRPIGELARDVEFFDADVAIATGQRTGDPAGMEELRSIAAATTLPVMVGSGATADNIGELLTVADGIIVASWLKRDGVWWNQVDPDRLDVFMRAVNQARG